MRSTTPSEFLRFGRATALLAGGVEELCEESYFGFGKVGVISSERTAAAFRRRSRRHGAGRRLGALDAGDRGKRRSARREAAARDLRLRRGARRARYQRVPRARRRRDRGDRAGAARGRISGRTKSAASSPALPAAAPATRWKRTRCAMYSARAWRQIPVCAPKAAFGEAMGASGAFCALTAGLALQSGVWRRQPDSVRRFGSLRLSAAPQEFSGEYALVNCFGCDGNNAALVLKGLS